MNEIKLPSLEGVIDFLKQYRYVVLMMIVGVILLLLPTGKGEEAAEALSADTALDQWGQEEVEELEKRLSHILSQIAGAGETTIVLTVERSGEKKLAENLEQNDNQAVSETVILTDSERGEEVVELQSTSPTYRGALVVSQGAASAAVQLELRSAVSVLTGLPSNRIAVCASSGK